MSVEALRNHSIGAPTRAIARMIRAERGSDALGWTSAIRLGDELAGNQRDTRCDDYDGHC